MTIQNKILLFYICIYFFLVLTYVCVFLHRFFFVLMDLLSLDERRRIYQRDAKKDEEEKEHIKCGTTFGSAGLAVVLPTFHHL